MSGREAEVLVDVIVHATEDVDVIYGAFWALFGLQRDRFALRSARGHFDNPITVMSARVSGAAGVRRILDRVSSDLSRAERAEILDTIGERTDGSGLHVRVGKQEFVRGRVSLGGGDAVRLRIRAPAYRKRDAPRAYRDLLAFRLD